MEFHGGILHGKSVRFKKHDVTESRYGQTISSHSFSQALEQVNEGWEKCSYY